MNSKFLKSIVIGMLKPLTSLDEAGELLIGVGNKNIYVTIAGVIMIVLGKIFHALLMSAVAVKETIPTLLEYHPTWLRNLSIEEKESRTIGLNNRIKRETLRIKEDWLKKYGTQEAIDEMLKKARKPSEG